MDKRTRQATSEDQVRDRLVAAAAGGEIVQVVYHRGSQPGTVREIAPVAVNDGRVISRDLTAGVDKVFKLAYLDLVETEASAPPYNPNPAPIAPVVDSRTVREALISHVDALEALGWHVELTEHCISLHRFFKNGKTRRGYDVRLAFDEFTVDFFDDGDGRGLQQVTRPSQRPYNLSNASLTTQTFTRLSSALPLFLEEARKLAPQT